MAKKQKFYITTSIMYANADPHLGFAMELIQADVLARHHRLKGDDTFFLTGIDEHGKKVFEAAQKAGIKPKKIVDEKSKKLKELADKLNISNDFFIRTTDKKLHWPAVKKLWEILEKKGDIYKKEYQGLYCVGCEAFKISRELADGKCPIHLKEPEVVKEENYFFKISKYLPKVQKLLEKNKIKIYPESRKLESVNMIKDGMDDISVSRPTSQVSWGIPVPGDKSQSIYVWIDALPNYISAIDYAKNGAKLKKYWPADTHLIGKDILKFHTIIWPAVLLSAGLDLPKNVLVHGFITHNGHKMSKSLGNVVDPFVLIEKYGQDAFRYYFLSEASMFADIDFTEGKFAAKYNSDLASGLGNLANRILNIAKKNESLLKNLVIDYDKNSLKGVHKKVWKDYLRHIENYELNGALGTIWQFITYNNQLVEAEKLWELPKTDAEKFRKCIAEFIENIVFIGWMLQPFLPETSDKIFLLLNLKKNNKQSWRKQKIKIGEIKPLFPRIGSSF